MIFEKPLRIKMELALLMVCEIGCDGRGAKDKWSDGERRMSCSNFWFIIAAGAEKVQPRDNRKREIGRAKLFQGSH